MYMYMHASLCTLVSISILFVFFCVLLLSFFIDVDMVYARLFVSFFIKNGIWLISFSIEKKSSKISSFYKNMCVCFRKSEGFL